MMIFCPDRGKRGKQRETRWCQLSWQRGNTKGKRGKTKGKRGGVSVAGNMEKQRETWKTNGKRGGVSNLARGAFSSAR